METEDERFKKEMIAMPGRDGTGARGMGPMGGKPAGCGVDHQATNSMGQGQGQGRGLGRGHCRRFRNGVEGISDAAPTATCEQELEMLKQQAEYLKTAAEEISARIQELEAHEKVNEKCGN
jgi:hypothetical protein